MDYSFMNPHIQTLLRAVQEAENALLQANEGNFRRMGDDPVYAELKVVIHDILNLQLAVNKD